MKLRFITDFARNWKTGDVVEAKPLSNGDTLVDDVALIDTALLMEYCEVVMKESEDKK